MRLLHARLSVFAVCCVCVRGGGPVEVRWEQATSKSGTAEIFDVLSFEGGGQQPRHCGATPRGKKGLIRIEKDAVKSPGTIM